MQVIGSNVIHGGLKFTLILTLKAIRLNMHISDPDSDNTDIKKIVLCGPCAIQNKDGVSVAIESIYINSTGYIPDVYVALDPIALDATENDEDLPLNLYDDNTFIDAVMGRLRDAGYRGPKFDRAELGMQTDGCIALEPPDEFNEFALSKGWLYADGLEALRCNKIIGSVDWKSKLEFASEDGTKFSIRLSPLIEMHSVSYKTEFGGDRDTILADISIPLFRDTPDQALKWILEKADWDEVRDLIDIELRQPPDSRVALARDAQASFRWVDTAKPRPGP